MFVVVGTVPNLQSPPSLLDADVCIGTVAGLDVHRRDDVSGGPVTLAVEARADESALG